MTASHSLKWSHGEATIVATAATVTDLTFTLPNGPFRPFARAPWVGKVDDPAITGHLRVLSGDFVGIPFGMGGRSAPNLPEWQKLLTQPANGTIHGPSAHLDWTIVSGDDRSVTLTLDYEPHSVIRRLERTVTARDGSPSLDFTLKIFARHKGSISCGLHPNFRLPEQPGRLKLDIGFNFGLVYPGRATGPDAQEFSTLASVPKDGGHVDMTHVPLTPSTEFNVQMCGVTTPLTGIYLDEGAGFELDWDRTLLPTLMFWHTDGGITGEPWNGQFRALGCEPLASTFDFHTDVSTGPNPINRRGVKTWIDIDPAAPLEIRHSVRGFAT